VTEPVRTCCGCRRKAPQAELWRFASKDGELVRDDARALPGRGAYTCPDSACYRLAAKRRAFARTLRAPVRVPEDVPPV
jgi:predicted RNA-binding protein YlxR (DUF448 family)